MAASSRSASVLLPLLLLLLLPWVSAQVANDCASDGSPRVRLAAQLSVSGCPIFVHDTGASDGPHLEVEPIMCLAEGLHKLVAPRYDPVTQQAYVSVPVMLRDDAILAEVQRQLHHLSPKSVRFATVSDISVSTDASSVTQALGFDWRPEESTGILRLGCTRNDGNCSAAVLYLRVRTGRFEDLDAVLLQADLATPARSHLRYRLASRNRNLTEPNTNSLRYPCLPTCKGLRLVKSIRLNNCTVLVHQRLDTKGHFLIEPLLCPAADISKESTVPIMHDYSRDVHYLKLNVLLQDDAILDAVKTLLADLHPRSVAFMRLWRAQCWSPYVDTGPLMVSADWKLAQLRVYCGTERRCLSTRKSFASNPIHLWRQLKWTVTSTLNDTSCLHVSSGSRYMTTFPIREMKPSAMATNDRRELRSWVDLCNPKLAKLSRTISSLCLFKQSQDGRKFLVIQQRLTGTTSFQRTWEEYETGFGYSSIRSLDRSDFWIGLHKVHLLSLNGATLRVEMTLLNGTELRVEYAGFNVGAATTNYSMTYADMLKDRSSDNFDSMSWSKGMQFSTMDRDNDRWDSGSCSNLYGNGGWWFNNCMSSNPNGLLSSAPIQNPSYMYWYNWSSVQELLRNIRLMLQV